MSTEDESPGGEVGSEEVVLRPFREPDFAIIERFFHEREFSWPFEWSGYKSIEMLRQRFREDGLLENDPQYLVISLGSSAIGWVVWRDENAFNQEGTTHGIGIVLAPLNRGQGYGTIAQTLLRDHLFSTTRVHRIVAHVEADNVPEQRSLEKCDFRCEGNLVQAGWRDGNWRDLLLYACLRSDWDASLRTEAI